MNSFTRFFRRPPLQSIPRTLTLHRLLQPAVPPLFSNPSCPRLQLSTMSSAMARRLSKKTILITGASVGIGRSTALEFARTAPDCRLILTARRESALQELKSTIESETNNTCQVLVWKMDMMKSEEVEGLLERLPEGWREVDVLVNNAYVSFSITPPPTLLELNLSFGL